jgi:hypothetical protein
VVLDVDRHVTVRAVLAVVRPTGPGTVTVIASAPGCEDGRVTVEAR